MPHDAGEPFRISGPAAHDTGDFLIERPDDRPFGTGMIVVKGSRRLAAQGFHGRGKTTLELIIVIGIKQIVLPVVLVLDHRPAARTRVESIWPSKSSTSW